MLKNSNYSKAKVLTLIPIIDSCNIRDTLLLADYTGGMI